MFTTDNDDPREGIRMTETYVRTDDLDAVIREALASVKYGRKDIRVETRESVVLAQGGQDGRQAFTVLVDLASNRHETHWGSWGGANMFNPDNPVDLDRTPHVLPPNGLAIIGIRGGSRPTWAMIIIPPSMTARILPPIAGPELSAEMLEGLYCHRAYKGGAYRREELRRRHVSAAAIDALVTLGMISRNKAGATAITTDGRNALASSAHPNR